MTDQKEHTYIPKLKEQLSERKIDRRDFLRTATLLGVSAAAAYEFAGRIEGRNLLPRASAQSLPKGGTLRMAFRIPEFEKPHTFSWGGSDIARGIVEYLTRTGTDNVTRPSLCESWSTSADLKTWDLHLRKDVTWNKGQKFVADDVVWNLQHVLDPATGSSVLGLMKGYMMNDEGTELWDANAIEKVDDHTVRLNCRNPQLAVPEHLFHYPMHIMHPESDGIFGPGANGTGPFEILEVGIGTKAVIKARKSGTWGPPVHLDTMEFLDLGDDPAAAVNALISKQVHGIQDLAVEQLEIIKQVPHINIYDATTARTGVVRMRVTEAPFDDPRVRKAVRMATDSGRTLELALQNQGTAAEHHHVCPIHPEYAELAEMTRDIAGAKKLLAEAGHPDGVEVTIDCKKDPAWEFNAVQAMVEQWKEAGIKTKINLMPSSSYWDIWDKTAFGFTSWTHRPLGVMVLGLAYRSGVPWNETAYTNTEFDRLLTKAEGLLDVNERKEVVKELEKIMQEDGPIAQPLWRKTFTAFDKRVKNVAMHPTGYYFPDLMAIEPA
jgi:peptide/nickel transport system substrate-binding protein